MCRGSHLPRSRLQDHALDNGGECVEEVNEMAEKKVTPKAPAAKKSAAKKTATTRVTKRTQRHMRKQGH